MRNRIKRDLGIEIYDIYGLTEIYGQESESAAHTTVVCITGTITFTLKSLIR